MHHSQSVPVSPTNEIKAFCRKIGNSIAALAGGLWTRFPEPKLLESYKRQHQEKRPRSNPPRSRRFALTADDAHQLGQQAL